MAETASALLHLRASESVPEILARIRSHREPLVVLYCPEYAPIRRDPLLRRLVRAAALDLGKDVVFRFGDGVKSVPEALVARRGVRPPTAARPGRPPAARLPAPRPPGRPTLSGRPPRFILPLFTLIAGSVLALVILFVLPRAKVTLVVSEEPLITDLVVRLDAAATAAHVPSGTFPARAVTIDEEVSEEFPVETIVQKGERARGTVELVNATGSPQPIRAGTRLKSAAGVIVRTERGVIIPPNGRASVGVHADAGGLEGNLEPQRLTIPGLPPEAQRLIAAEVVTALRGGTDRPVRELTRVDVDRAAETLRTKVEQRLREKIQAEVAERDGRRGGAESIVWLNRPDLTRVVLSGVKSGVPPGVEVERFRLTARVRAEALTADERALRDFLRGVLETRADPEKAVPEDAIALSDLRLLDVRWDKRWAELSLHVETTVAPALHPDLLRERLAGRKDADAETFLKNLPGVRSASVSLSPVWVKHVPGNPRNVHVQISRQSGP